MGCRKLSYYERQEGLEQSVIFYGGAYEKNATVEKFCTNYYPFGLQHPTSWTRITDLKNNFLYNAGSELNEQTKNYETFYRDYDPALGRFNQIDPKAAKYMGHTPYEYAANDPVGLNDPMGDDWMDDMFSYSGWMTYQSTGPANDGRGNTWGGNNYGGNLAAYNHYNNIGTSYDPRYDFNFGSSMAWEQKYRPDLMTDQERNRMAGNLANSSFTNEDAFYVGQALGLNVYVNGQGGLSNITYANIVSRINGIDVGSRGQFTSYDLFSASDDGQAQAGTLNINPKLLGLMGAVNSAYALGNEQALFELTKANKLVRLVDKGKYLGARTFSNASIIFNVVVAGAQFASSDKSGADYARLVGAGLIFSTSFIPMVGPAVSFGLTIADTAGAFDGIYSQFDDPTATAIILNSALSRGMSITGPFRIGN